MPIFTFYPCQNDGGAASFEAFELADDSSVPGRARMVLSAHPSARYINVWRADRKVLTLYREELQTSAREAAFERDLPWPS